MHMLVCLQNDMDECKVQWRPSASFVTWCTEIYIIVSNENFVEFFTKLVGALHIYTIFLMAELNLHRNQF